MSQYFEGTFFQISMNFWLYLLQATSVKIHDKLIGLGMPRFLSGNI